MPGDGYDVVANEYYDPRHITSRNFDATTLTYLAEHPFAFPTVGLALDVGAGRGRLGEYCGISSHRVIQVDLSIRMLRLLDREAALGRVLADAHRLPFESEAFTLVGAFLFDPFNTKDVFAEIARVVRRNGIFIGTLPHDRWGRALRDGNGSPPDKAVFALKGGERIASPSFLSSPKELKRRISGAGLQIIRSEALNLPQNISRVSPDIELPAHALHQSVYHIPVLQLVIAKRI